MIKFKKLFVAAIALGLSSAAFAITSKTSDTTAGVFSTDTDNFVSVNDWQSVNPNNLFGVFGYYSTKMKIGAAKNIGGFYFGALYEGDLGNSFTSTTTTTDSTTTSKVTHTNACSRDFSFLMGIGNDLGIKFRLYQYTNSKSSTEVNATTTTEAKYDNWNPELYAGYNLKLGDYLLKNYAATGLYIDQSETITKTDSATVTTGDITKTLSFGLGSTVVFPSKNNFNQSVNIPLSLGFEIPEKDSTASGFYLAFIPAYTVTYDKIDRLTLGASAKLDTTFKTSKTDDSTSSNGIDIYPYFNLALQYKAVPDKFTINAGASVAMPNWSFVNEKTGSTSTSTNSGTSSSGEVSLSSGFSAVLAKTVTFDCNYNVLGDLLSSSLHNKWATGSDTSILNNLNLIFFHYLSMNISVKF